jgi:nucleotide-binding universal stress UspA family protein
MVEFDEIVVPVDGSEGATRAATFAARLASMVQCPIRLAYVFPATSMANIGFSRMNPDEFKTAQNSAAKDIFAKARAAIGDTKAAVEELVLLGDPAYELIGYIDQHPKALVVMGRRGLSPMKSLLMGSVSEKVARHARGAVTLVN